MRDALKLKGIWEFELIDKRTGKVIDKEVKENIIVNTGKERVAKLINGVSTTYFDYIAIGTGTTSPTANDSSLESEDTRAQATCSYESSYKAKLEHTFDFTSSKAITEAGIFDSATPSGSVMLNRLTFSAKNVDSNTSLKVTITITVS